MKSRFAHAGMVLIFAASSVCCMRPAATPTPSESRSTSKTFWPNEVPGESASDDELVGLLQEQNKRLKAQVQRLEKENAELKSKLSEKQ